jgi:hypothetical protein
MTQLMARAPRHVVAIALAAGVVAFAAAWLMMLPGPTVVMIGGPDNLCRVYPPGSGAPPRVLISLHTWNGDYLQEDPMLGEAMRRGWGYIRPDLGGPNNRPESCLAPEVIDRLDEVVDFCGAAWGVPPERVHLVGHSGGGFTALGYWHLGRRRLGSIQAWNPIADLFAWHEFCRVRPHLVKYSEGIESAIGGPPLARADEARRRSPVYMAIPPASRPVPLRIYAGISDGWKGSVPVSQSTRYVNRLAEHGLIGRISSELAELLHGGDMSALAGHPLLVANGMLVHGNPSLRLHVFDGGHEMRVPVSWQHLENE